MKSVIAQQKPEDEVDDHVSGAHAALHDAGPTASGIVVDGVTGNWKTLDEDARPAVIVD